MDTYLALERGMADGVFTPYPILRPFKISEVTKFHTQADLMVMPFYAVMNPSRFKSLTPGHQKIIEETTGAKMARACGIGLENGTIEDVSAMKADGNTFYVLSDKEKARWVKAVMPIRENWLKKMEGKGYKNVRDILSTAIELTEKYSKK
jgi:TRAP-type C4-dicarboxylate transport system substrate-binding protein